MAGVTETQSGKFYNSNHEGGVKWRGGRVQYRCRAGLQPGARAWGYRNIHNW